MLPHALLPEQRGFHRYPSAHSYSDHKKGAAFLYLFSSRTYPCHESGIWESLPETDIHSIFIFIVSELSGPIPIYRLSNHIHCRIRCINRIQPLFFLPGTSHVVISFLPEEVAGLCKSTPCPEITSLKNAFPGSTLFDDIKRSL